MLCFENSIQTSAMFDVKPHVTHQEAPRRAEVNEKQSCFRKILGWDIRMISKHVIITVS